MDNLQPIPTKFSFSKFSEDGQSVEMIFQTDDEVTWTELLNQFILFIRGCGYELTQESIAVNSDLHCSTTSVSYFERFSFSEKNEKHFETYNLD